MEETLEKIDSLIDFVQFSESQLDFLEVTIKKIQNSVPKKTKKIVFETLEHLVHHFNDINTSLSDLKEDSNQQKIQLIELLTLNQSLFRQLREQSTRLNEQKTNEKEEVEKRTEEFEYKYKTSQKQLQAVSSALELLNTKFKQISDEKSNLEIVYSRLDYENSQLWEQLESSRKSVSDLEETIRAKDRANRDTTVELNGDFQEVLENELKLQNRVKELQEALDKIQRERDSASGYEKMYKEACDEIQELKKKIEDNQLSTIKTKNKEIEGLEEKLELVNEDKIEQEKEVRSLKKTSKALSAQVKRLEEQLSDLKEEMAVLEDSNESYQDKLFSFKEENGNLEEECIVLKKDKANLGKKVLEGKSELQAQKVVISELKQNLIDLEKKSRVLKEESQAQTKEIKSLKNTNAILRDQLIEQKNVSESIMSTDNESSLDLLKNTLSEILESGESMLQTSFSQDRLTLENKIRLLEEHAVEFRRLINNKNTEMKDKETAMQERIGELEETLDLTVKKYKKVKRNWKESLDESEELKTELETSKNKLRKAKSKLKEFEALMQDTKF